MDGGLEDSEAIDLNLVAQMDFSPLDDAHLGSGFDSDSDHLGLFEDHDTSLLVRSKKMTIEDRMGIPNSEDTQYTRMMTRIDDR
jgi:hypothetical protein